MTTTTILLALLAAVILSAFADSICRKIEQLIAVWRFGK